MNDINNRAIEYLNKLIKNNWIIVSFSNDTIGVYTDRNLEDISNVINSLELYEIPYDPRFIGTIIKRVNIKSINLINHKSKNRNDKIDIILND